MKLTNCLFAIFLGVITILALISSTKTEANRISLVPPPIHSKFEQNPPIPVAFWIRLLEKTNA
jgi:hypothetical protein